MSELWYQGSDVDCPACGCGEYTWGDGCPDCGHYDEIGADVTRCDCGALVPVDDERHVEVCDSWEGV